MLTEIRLSIEYNVRLQYKKRPKQYFLMTKMRVVILKVLIALLIFIDIGNCQKAIIMSSSLGYYNIRQVNNVVNIYHHLKKNGFKNQDILLYIGQIQACCQKNHKYGTLSFFDGDYTNIFKDIEIDYYQSNMNAQSVSQVMMGFYSPSKLNKRKLQINQDEPLFIYVTGHGGDYYFKIRQKQALITEQFEQIFNILSSKKSTEKIALLSDSCSAITPFQTVTIPKFVAIGSSSFSQKSLSHGYDLALNQPKTDDFSFYLDEILSEKASMKGVSKLDDWTFPLVQKYMSFDRLKVNSKLISRNISKNQKIMSFLRKKKKQVEYHKIKKYNLSEYFNE